MKRLLFITLLVVFACEDKDKDCAGVKNGTAVLDECGICNGDNSSCRGCTDSIALNYDSLATIDAPCLYLPYCNDAVDNDGDGLIDAEDPDCETGGTGEIFYEYFGTFYGPFCNDAVDNDGDGLIDAEDPDCLTGKECPLFTSWYSCGSACPPSCGNPNPVCTLQCVAGCFSGGYYDEQTGQNVSSLEECSYYINCNNAYSECLTDCCNQFLTSEDNCDESVENWEEGNNTAPEECFDACLLVYNECSYCFLHPYSYECGW